MADAKSAPEAAATTTTEAAPGLLDQILTNTKQTEPDRAQDLVKTLVEQALAGTVTFDRNLTRTFDKAVKAIDAKMSQQLNAIMHDPKFLKLEGSWRGLHYLVQNSETGTALKLRVLNMTKRELGRDLSRAIEFDQSQLFKKIYENEFGTPGGEPYAAMIGDYEFSNHPDDIDLLRGLSTVAASAFAPFISAASPKLFEFNDWRELPETRDLQMVFEGPKYGKWRSLRDSDDSRFLCLTMPRALARLPYGADTKPIEQFEYEEGKPGKAMPHDNYCWMNSAYVMGARLTDSFARSGFCTSIRGVENGGKVENLPTHTFTSDDGDVDAKCPTEIGITDRREAELSKLGFLPLCHFKNTDYAVFFGAQTVQKPKKYDRPEATANAAISARLPYMMATGRFAHYLKVMARDWIGSHREAEGLQKDLNRWISNYVNANESASPEAKSRYPLREAEVKVEAVPGSPGSYNAVAYLRPWLQLEELTASLRMVARIPKMAG